MNKIISDTKGRGIHIWEKFIANLFQPNTLKSVIYLSIFNFLLRKLELEFQKIIYWLYAKRFIFSCETLKFNFNKNKKESL